MEYIDSSEIIMEVINKMPSYFESNKVDESILYPVLRKCMDRMGLGHNEESKAIIEINGSKGDLPDDFKLLCSAVSCVGKTMDRPVPNQGLMVREEYVKEIKPCDTFEVHIDDCGKMTKLVQELRHECIQWNDFQLLTVTKESMPLCINGSPNYMSNNPKEISISNGKIIANFNTGTVYIEYLTDNKTKTGFKVPKNGTVIEWIKDEMILEVLTYLFINGEPNIQARLQLMKGNAHISQEQARPIWKRSSFKEFYNLSNHLSRRYLARARPLLNGQTRRYTRR